MPWNKTNKKNGEKNKNPPPTGVNLLTLSLYGPQFFYFDTNLSCIFGEKNLAKRNFIFTKPAQIYRLPKVAASNPCWGWKNRKHARIHVFLGYFSQNSNITILWSVNMNTLGRLYDATEYWASVSRKCRVWKKPSTVQLNLIRQKHKTLIMFSNKKIIQIILSLRFH